MTNIKKNWTPSTTSCGTMGSRYTHTHTHPTPRQPTVIPSQKPEKITHKWAPFTYFGRETTFVTNIFKKTDIRITLRTNNTLQKTANAKTPNPRQIQQIRRIQNNMPRLQQGVCRADGICFTQRFKEHRNALKSGRNTSNYAKHALEHSHPFGPIQETMQILQYQAKGAHLNTIERYLIYK